MTTTAQWRAMHSAAISLAHTAEPDPINAVLLAACVGIRFNDFLTNSNQGRIGTQLLIPDKGITRMLFTVQDTNGEPRSIGSIPVDELGFNPDEIAIETVAEQAAHGIEPQRVQIVDDEDDEQGNAT